MERGECHPGGATGFTRQNDVQRASNAGFDAHVGKPLTMEVLTSTTRRIMDQDNAPA